MSALPSLECTIKGSYVCSHFLGEGGTFAAFVVCFLVAMVTNYRDLGGIFSTR